MAFQTVQTSSISYIVIAYVVMAYVVMVYVVMDGLPDRPNFVDLLCNYGFCSYGLCSYGLCSYGLCSDGLSDLPDFVDLLLLRSNPRLLLLQLILESLALWTCV